MTLKEIQEAMIAAMKAHTQVEVDVLRSAIAAIKKTAIDKRVEIDEKLVDEVLLKEQKTIQEMIDTCPETRQDLLDEYNYKLLIIKQFAPQLETDSEIIKTIITNMLAEAGIEPAAANKGQIMKTVMPVLKGKVDMTIANKVITDLMK